jgi:hypothetical protein
MRRVAGLSGLGFILILLVANLILSAGGFPVPSERPALDAVVAAYSAGEGTLHAASALLPAAWLLATVFAAGLFVSHPTGNGWAVVGLAGVLMQSVTFAAVEATRLAVAAAATAGTAIDGLWALHNALFGFNQVFLATALLGLSLSGVRRMARWHVGVGLVGAVLLFASATGSPFGTALALSGLIGWLLWLVWIGAHAVTLIRTRPERDALSAPSTPPGRRDGQKEPNGTNVSGPVG